MRLERRFVLSNHAVGTALRSRLSRTRAAEEPGSSRDGQHFGGIRLEEAMVAGILPEDLPKRAHNQWSSPP